MTAPRATPRSTSTPAGLGRKVLASLVTVAVTAGVVGLATFGRFDDERDIFTRSQHAAGTAPR